VNENEVSLFLNPFIAGNTDLPENSYKKIHTDFCTVWIWKRKHKGFFDHIGVFSPMKRAFKPE